MPMHDDGADADDGALRDIRDAHRSPVPITFTTTRFLPLAVELGVEDLLPRTEIERAVR